MEDIFWHMLEYAFQIHLHELLTVSILSRFRISHFWERRAVTGNKELSLMIWGHVYSKKKIGLVIKNNFNFDWKSSSFLPLLLSVCPTLVKILGWIYSSSDIIS